MYTQIAYATGIAAGSNTVTVTWNPSINYGFASVLEIGPSSFDQAAAGTGNSSTPSAGSITTPVNGALAVATSFIDDGSGSGSAYAAGAGWTLFQNTGGGAADEGSEYQAQATAGQLTGSFTASSGTWVASMATFVPGGGNEVRSPRFAFLPDMTASQLIGPNPISVEFFKQYLRANKNITVYDMAGHAVNKADLGDGIYMVRKNAGWQKIMVVK
jgi:hypothetical protein